MKLYAIRDRLLAYFMTPFVAESDKPVMHSLAQLINGDNDHAINKAPHHFELWALATINDETGDIRGPAEFLCDCASLVRGDIRHERAQGAPGGASTARPSPGSPQRPNGLTGAQNRSAEGPEGPETVPASHSRAAPGTVHS